MPHDESSKNVWKFWKPSFSDKTTTFYDETMLVKIATNFSNYFNNITKKRNIKKWCKSKKFSGDPLVNAIWKFEKSSKYN